MWKIRDIEAQNNEKVVLYQFRKERFTGFIFWFLLIIPIFFLYVSLKDLLITLFYDTLNFHLGSSYIALGISTGFTIFCFFLLSSFHYNSIGMSENYLIIIKGFLGRLVVLPKALVEHKGIYTSTYRFTSNIITFYLNCGGTVSTGFLYCDNEDITEIYKKFQYKINKRWFRPIGNPFGQKGSEE